MAPSLPALSVRIESADFGSLFDPPTAAVYPHTGPSLAAGLESYLESSVRAKRIAPSVNVEIHLRLAAPDPAQEDLVRQRWRTYFQEEGALAALDLKVNQTEGWGFFRRTFPLLAVALALAGGLVVFGPDFPSGPLGTFVTTLFYLLFITVVWVLLWDPIEKLLFDAYLLRARQHALAKLAAASIRFSYASAPAN